MLLLLLYSLSLRYFALFESIGTMMVVKSVAGGSIEKVARVQNSLWDIDLGGLLPNLDWVKDSV